MTLHDVIFWPFQHPSCSEMVHPIDQRHHQKKPKNTIKHFIKCSGVNDFLKCNASVKYLKFFHSFHFFKLINFMLYKAIGFIWSPLTSSRSFKIAPAERCFFEFSIHFNWDLFLIECGLVSTEMVGWAGLRQGISIGNSS